MIPVSSSERSYEDLRFGFSAAEDVFYVNSMHAETIGCEGVAEFIIELLKQTEALDRVDTLIPVVINLLKKKRCPWAKKKGKMSTDK